MIHESPDRASIRNNLLEIADRIEIRDLSELTFREQMAVWQLQQFRESRAYVYMDRIAYDTTAAADTPSTVSELEQLVLTDLFRKISGEDPDGRTKGVPFIERITLAARLLAVGSLIAGGLIFYGLLVYTAESTSAGTGVSVGLLLLIAVAGGVAIWATGVFVLRRMGIRFWITETKASDDEKPRPGA